VLSIALVAVAMGLSNLAASIGIGISGVDRRLRFRIAIIFGCFEALMPLVGLVVGHRVADSVGSTAALLGGGLLVVTGIVTIVQARRGNVSGAPRSTRLPSLIVTGAALSIDNLVVGFALGAYDVPVALAALVFAVVGVGMSFLGLELGRRLGTSVERWSAEIGGAVLALVGVVIAAVGH